MAFQVLVDAGEVAETGAPGRGWLLLASLAFLAASYREDLVPGPHTKSLRYRSEAVLT